MTSINKEKYEESINKEKYKTDTNKRNNDISWIIILIVLTGINIYWRRKKEFIKMINTREFLVGILFVTIFICVIFFNKDNLYKKSIYAATIAFIIAICAHLKLIFAPFFIVLSFAMAFPSLHTE